MKKMVLLDLDNTLFDTKKFRQEFFNAIADSVSASIDKSKAEAACQFLYEEIMKEHGVFSPRVFLDRLEVKLRVTISKKHLLSLISDEISKKYLYSEVSSVIAKLLQLGDVGIFSQGDRELQKTKLTSLYSHIPKRNIHIVRNKKLNMKRIFDRYSKFRLFFIDDMLPMLYKAKKINPEVFAIWIRRGRYAKKLTAIEGFSPDAIIDTLSQAVPYVEQN